MNTIYKIIPNLSKQRQYYFKCINKVFPNFDYNNVHEDNNIKTINNKYQICNTVL